MGQNVSGYVRSFNTGDVFLINIMGFSLGLALCSNPSFIGFNGPTASIGVVIVIGTLLAICNGLLYGWFSAVYPCAGGDYVFISRSLGKVGRTLGIGFLASFGFTVCQIYGLSSNLQLIPEMALAPFFESLGIPIDFSQKWLRFLPCILCLLYFAIIMINRSINPFFRRLFLWVFFAFGLLGPIIMIVSFYCTPTDSFIQAFNDYMNGSEAYNNVISSASHVGNSMLIDTIKALPLGFLCFMGFTYSVYSGAEVSNPKRSQVLGIIIALFIGFITFFFGMTAYVNMVGQGFHANIGHVSNFEFSLQSAASLIIENRFWNILMNIGITIWWIAVPYIMFQVCIHNIVAWSVDDIIPEKFLRRYNGVPVYCAILVLLISELILLLAIHSNSDISLTNAVALASITFMLVGLCALLLKPDSNVYRRLPEFAKKDFLWVIPNVSWFTGLGVVCLLAFGGLVVKALRYPEGGSVTNALFWTIGIYVIGFIYYRLRIIYLKNKSNNEIAGFEEEVFNVIPDDINDK